MIIMMAFFLFFSFQPGLFAQSVPAQPQQEAVAAVQAGEIPVVPLAGGIQGKISLDLRNIDVVDALKYLAMKAGLNIITTKGVIGRVTLMVDNALVQDVFDIMLRSNALAYDIQGGIFNVMTQEEYKVLYGKNFADVRQVKLMRLNYAIPEQAFSLFDLLKSDIGRILVDPESGSVLVMDSPEKIATMERVLKGFEEKNAVRIFKINYARAKDIEETLKIQLDAKKVGLIKADEKSNQVIVQTLPERMKQIEGLITQLDQKTKEILVESRIVQIKLNDSTSTGIEWEGLFDLGTKFGLTYLGSYPFSSVAPATDGFQSRKSVYDALGNVGSYPFSGTTSNLSASQSRLGLSELHLGVIGSQDFDTVFKFLQTIGETRMLSNPKIAVVNNQEAKIHVGQKDAYVTTTTTTGQTTSTISEQVTFIDVGVLLSVVPTINYDGFITLKVKAEVNSVVDTLITPTKNEIPILDTSLAETTVMVKDGTTIVIGGLRRDIEVETVNQTPVLGKIPFIGALFRTTEKSKNTSELLIMLTPTIISGEVMVSGIDRAGVGGEPIKSLKEYSGELKDKNAPAVSDQGAQEIFVPGAAGKMSPKGLKP